MTLGPHAKARFYFELDEQFPDHCEHILKGYDEVSRMASISAKFAMRLGTLNSIRTAQWWEAVAGTLEQCLHSLQCEETLVLPDPPDFK